MIAINLDQAKFYDQIQHAEEFTGSGGYAKNERANALTKIWAALRYRQQEAVKQSGISERVLGAHLEWAAEKAGGSFLEIGCFSGSPYTFNLVSASGRYTGIELSGAACESLRTKAQSLGYTPPRMTVVCGDLLTFEADQKYDLIYAHGVLHHFENPAPLFEKIRDLIADDGVLVFVEPVAINPVFHLLRNLYRPFQSDAAWEWPFRQRTVDELCYRFRIADGFGWGRASALLSLVSGIPGLFGLYKRIARRELLVKWNDRRYWSNSMVVAKCEPLVGQN
jgi:SAM-dependent methyltransferase